MSIASVTERTIAIDDEIAPIVDENVVSTPEIETEPLPDNQPATDHLPWNVVWARVGG